MNLAKARRKAFELTLQRAGLREPEDSSAPKPTAGPQGSAAVSATPSTWVTLLPDIQYPSFQIEGGPLIAVMTSLFDYVEKIVESLPPFTSHSLGTQVREIRQALNLSAMAYYSPRKDSDPETYGIELMETARAQNSLRSAVKKAFQNAGEIACKALGYQAPFQISVYVPSGGDTSSLKALKDCQNLQLIFYDDF